MRKRSGGSIKRADFIYLVICVSPSPSTFHRDPQRSAESQKHRLGGLNGLDQVWASGPGLEESFVWRQPQWPLSGNWCLLPWLHTNKQFQDRVLLLESELNMTDGVYSLDFSLFVCQCGKPTQASCMRCLMFHFHRLKNSYRRVAATLFAEQKYTPLVLFRSSFQKLLDVIKCQLLTSSVWKTLRFF